MCFCSSKRNASIVIAILSLIGCVLQILQTSIIAQDLFRLNDQPKLNLAKGLVLGTLIVNLIHFPLGGLLLKGCKDDIRKFILPWLIFNVGIANPWNVIVTIALPINGITASITVVAVLSLVLGMYFTYEVWRFYRFGDEDQPHQSHHHPEAEQTV